MSISAEINPAFIIERAVLILGLAVGLIALKGLMLLALARNCVSRRASRMETALLLGPGGEFGFVMTGAALATGLIDRTLATTLVSVIALSMLAIPALAKLGARMSSAPRAATDEAPLETPPESEEPRVIIVGYGRVGGLIGDMLREWHRIPFIALRTGTRAWRRVRRATASRSITATPRDRNTCAIAASRRRAPSSSPSTRPPPTKRW